MSPTKSPSGPASSNVYTVLLVAVFLALAAACVYVGMKNVALTKADQNGGSNPFFVLPRQSP